MKQCKAVMLFLLLFYLNSFGQLQPNNQTNYNSRSKPAVPVNPTYYPQSDMFVFRMVNGAQYTGEINFNYVEKFEYRGQYRDKLNIFYFKSTCTEAQRLDQIGRSKKTANYERDFKVTTLINGLPYIANQFLIEEDIITVVFNLAYLKSMNDITLFAQRNTLTLILKPQTFTSTGHSGLYAFKLNNKAEYSREKAALIKSNEILVQAIDPLITNMIRESYDTKETYSNLNPVSKKTEGIQGSCSKNDSQFKLQWSIYNDGSIYYQGNTANKKATAGADAKICDCWSTGYQGYGVKIAVMDGAGVQINHPDMKGQYVSGRNFQNTANPDGIPITKDIIPTDPSTKGYDHMMNTSSIIGAKNNDWYGMSGVAPFASVSPLLVDYNNSLTFYNAFNYLQKNVNAYDILNMSFSMPDNNTLHDIITYLADYGRTNQWNASKHGGMVLVASAGNNGQNAAAYPAAYEEVIGVINSNPNDFRHANGRGWGTSVGSTYGYYYDIAAPGTFMILDTYTGKGSSGVGTDLTIGSGTSYSAPLVSGIVALLIDKNQFVSYQTVRNILRNTAEKVNPTTYNYNASVTYPGKSEEMGYGRVHCFNALNLMTLESEELSAPQQILSLNTLVKDVINVKYSGSNPGSINYSVLDMFGKVITLSQLDLSSTSTIDASSLAEGMYIIHFFDNNNQMNVSYKIVKTN
jgi:hypothetical protein